jgi:hypothetical protein
MKKNIKKNPYLACDKCIAIRQAITIKDYPLFLELTGKTQSVKNAEIFINNHQGISNYPPETIDQYVACDEFLQEVNNEFSGNIPELGLRKCPFDYKPFLKRKVRVKYKLKCYHCHETFACPIWVLRDKKTKLPICLECFANFACNGDENWGDQQ